MTLEATLDRHNQCLCFRVAGEAKGDPKTWVIEPKTKLFILHQGEGVWLVRAHHEPTDDRAKYYLVLELPSATLSGILRFEHGQAEKVDAPDPLKWLHEAELVPALPIEDLPTDSDIGIRLFGGKGQSEATPSSERRASGTAVLEKGLGIAKHNAGLAWTLAELYAEGEAWADAERALSAGIEQQRPPPDAWLERRATWRRKLGNIVGAEADEKSVRQHGQSEKNKKRLAAVKALQKDPSESGLKSFLESGFVLPPDGRLLAALLGTTGNEKMLEAVLSAVEGLLDAKGNFSPRLLAQRLDTVILRLDGGKVEDHARRIRARLD